MAKLFKNIEPFEISDNVFKSMGVDSFLVTAGKKDHFNTMTAGWGGMGWLWKMPVVFCFIRPQRYTFEFMEKYDEFTISFFKKEYQKVLSVCGSVSGRVVDKMQITGLNPFETDSGNIYFEQARLVLECRKLYSDFIKEDSFLDNQIPPLIYPAKDFHKFYIGQVKQCLLSETE